MNDAEDHGSIFPVDPDSYNKLKIALRIFGGTARVYDHHGRLITEDEHYKPSPGTQVTENKELENRARRVIIDPEKTG